MLYDPPPSPSAWLDLFLASVDDYERLAEVLPVGDSFKLGVDRDPQDYWIAVLHAAVLRKYFATDDNLAIANITAAARELLADDRRGEIEALEEFDLQAGKAKAGGMSSFHIGADDPGRGAGEIAFEGLYGRHLHGDYKKWRASLRAAGVAEESTMHSWVLQARRLVRLLRAMVDDMVSRGEISMERPPTHPPQVSPPEHGSE